MISNIFYLLLITTALSLGDITEISSTDYILCRTCGQDVSSSNFIISKLSPSTHYLFNDTLFDKAGVQVQVFLTDLFFHYPLITVEYSTCAEDGEWEETTSWFPGFQWKPCVCPACGAYIGFVFEPINHTLVDPSKTFYGLILTSLISENCKRSSQFPVTVHCWSIKKLVMAADTLSSEDQDFLAKCEEELKHRFTEQDEEYMKVFNSDPPKPPILEAWWVPQNSGRRNDRRNNRRNHPYAQHGNQERGYHDRRDNRSNRGYNDYSGGYNDQGYDRHRSQRNRYNN